VSTFEIVEAGLPTGDDKAEWAKFWKSNKQPWRTEPRISKERQHYLAERRKIEPDIEEGIYPFKDIKLSRADIEWLLSTHENGRGPVNWNDERQREREGLDLRGAILIDEDLRSLPLAKLYCSQNGDEISKLIYKNMSTGDYLLKTQLQGADLSHAQLQGADLSNAQLQGANLFDTQLQGAKLGFTQLQKANLAGAQLQGADFDRANLQGASLDGAHLQEAFLVEVQLQRADLSYAQLQGADLSNAQLQGAILCEAQLQGTKIKDVELADVSHNGPQLADVQWGDTNLAVVDWSQVKRLGDESEAIQKVDSEDGQDKNSLWRFHDYQTATRAYRQLSVAMRNQGMNEDAARFAFRAQRMQRKAFWYQRKFGQYLFSGFLNLFAGYGYRFWRTFIAYALVIGIFATIYHLLGTNPAWNESIVISMTAFHGRGFFPEQFHPGDPQAMVAAIEAFVGLLIEITLIATLTQRFFGK
jgi:uncharacterized protein YjbI with pentapeptide repeats